MKYGRNFYCDILSITESQYHDIIIVGNVSRFYRIKRCPVIPTSSAIKKMICCWWDQGECPDWFELYNMLKLKVYELQQQKIKLGSKLAENLRLQWFRLTEQKLAWSDNHNGHGVRNNFCQFGLIPISIFEDMVFTSSLQFTHLWMATASQFCDFLWRSQWECLW